MLRVNHASRFDVAVEALRAAAAVDLNAAIATKSHVLMSSYQHQLREHEKYTVEHGEDPPELGSAPLFEA